MHCCPLFTALTAHFPHPGKHSANDPYDRSRGRMTSVCSRTEVFRDLNTEAISHCSTRVLLNHGPESMLRMYGQWREEKDANERVTVSLHRMSIYTEKESLFTAKIIPFPDLLSNKEIDSTMILMKADCATNLISILSIRGGRAIS